MISKIKITDDFCIDVPLAFAPMVGLSHSGLRSVIAEMGGCGLFFTEMLAAKRLPSENPNISTYLHKTDVEEPLFYQLFLGEECYVSMAVAKIEALSGAGIDLNLGCPAPGVKRGGAGASLAQDLPRVKSIVAAIRKSTNLPFSAKIRIGHPGKSEEFSDFCKMLEGEGVDLLTIHARYYGEKFCRRPHWQEIAPVRNVIKIPIIANGGIFTVSDAKNCLERTGADGLMIGRGGVEKPWLFAEIARDIYGVDVGEIDNDPCSIYFRVITKIMTHFAPERQLARIKLFNSYMASNHAFGHQLFSKVQGSRTVAEAVEQAKKFYGVTSETTS